METIEERVEPKIERVYYDLWGRESFYRMIEKYRLNDYLHEDCARYIAAVSIRENNKSFLERYADCYNTYGFKYCDMWLRGLLVSYVRRCSLECGDTPYKKHYYEDWLNNTKWISGKFPELQEWCDLYLKEWVEAVKGEKRNVQDEGEVQRRIKEDELKPYFQVAFYNTKNGGIDWFAHLCEDLKQGRTAKDFARIAYMIYDGGWLLKAKRPSTFSEWYQIFCDLVGCDRKKYKPNKVKDGLDGFSYLQNPRK